MICMPSYRGSSRVYHDGDHIIVPPNVSVEAQFVSDRLALGATWSLPWDAREAVISCVVRAGM